MVESSQRQKILDFDETMLHQRGSFAILFVPMVHAVDGSEIPNNHLGCIKTNIVDNGINYQPQILSTG